MKIDENDFQFKQKLKNTLNRITYRITYLGKLEIFTVKINLVFVVNRFM